MSSSSSSYYGHPSSDSSAPPLRGQGYQQQQQQQNAGSYGYGGEHAGRSTYGGGGQIDVDPYAQSAPSLPPRGNYTAAISASPYAASSYAASSNSFAASGTASPYHQGSAYGPPAVATAPYDQLSAGNSYGPQSDSSSYSQVPSAYGRDSYGQQQSSAYGQTYPPQAGQSQYRRPSFPPGTEPEIVNIFEQTDSDRSGYIDAAELGRVLSTRYTPFSPRTVRLILHLFAENQTDPTRVGPAGFVQAWRALKQWQVVFERFDRDISGTIEQNELQDALLSLGLAIPPQILQMLVSKYDSTGQGTSIGYDNFIQCGLIVKGLTEKFKEKDLNLRGSATLDYTTFMLMVLPFIIA